MATTTQQTIKRLYDQYKPQDFEYGLPGSDNLNPKREMMMDQLELLEKTLQETADNIIRKRINRKKEEAAKTQIISENPNPDLKRKQNALRTGSEDGNIFGLPDLYQKQIEELLGSFPMSLDGFEKPPIIDCDAVYHKYDFDIFGSEELTDADGFPTQVIKDADSDDDNKDNNNSASLYGSLYSVSENECAKIELEWLRLILLIIRIIKIIKMIIEFVISIIFTIIQIVCLAVGAWLNPPNIAQIIQILIGLAMAIIAQIIAMLIKFLFDLLNLDCLTDQTIDLLNQIIEAITTFSSTLGTIDPGAINILGKALTEDVVSMKDIVKQMMAAKKEAWSKTIEDLSETFSSENMKALSDMAVKTATETAVSSVKEYNNGALVKIANESHQVYNEALNAYDTAKKVMNDTVSAARSMYDTVKNFNYNSKPSDEGLASLQSKVFSGVSLS